MSGLNSPFCPVLKVFFPLVPKDELMEERRDVKEEVGSNEERRREEYMYGRLIWWALKGDLNGPDRIDKGGLPT